MQDTRRTALQTQIDELTQQLHQLQADLSSLPPPSPEPSSTYYDKNGLPLTIGDKVLFRPSQTSSKSKRRVPGIIISFTPARVYVRRVEDLRDPPQKLLRDPAHITKVDA